jgi:hypothetical protein
VRVAVKGLGIHIYVVMRLIHFAVVLAIGVVGCGGASVSAGKPPALTGEESTRAQKVRPGPPRLIAPPPAYGNKIVMAHRDDASDVGL